jgi:hypothetical protein
MSRANKAKRALRVMAFFHAKVTISRQGSSTGRRLTIQSALNAAQQRYERSDGNPLYVWQAVWMCMQPGEKVIPLPSWCTDYLHEVADNLNHLAAGHDFRDPATLVETGIPTGEELISFKTARELVSEALGLARNAWSAFKKAAGDAEKIRLKMEVDRLKYAGLTQGAAHTEAAKIRPNVNQDAIRKAVQGGKKLLAQTPEGARHGIREKIRRRSQRSGAKSKGKR